MGAHTAPRLCTVGRVAGRGALTAAAALALTGGTASFAFAGESNHDRSWSSDDDYEDGFRDGYRIGYHDGQDDEDDCDDEDGEHRHHDRWDDGKHDRGDKDHRRGGQIGARYDDSTHNGDDIYTVTNTVNKGLLAGIL